jgi:5,10-methenyltetrahydromethanopterin hydrogenase
MESVLLDAAGHRRSPATLPGYHRGRPPRNKGELYPADPPTVEEILAVTRSVGDRAEGHRLRALVVLLWRAGPADQRSAVTARGRSGLLSRRGARSSREGRQATLGRDGPLGVGAA